MGVSISYFVMVHNSVRYQYLSSTSKEQLELIRQSLDNNLKSVYNVALVQNKNENKNTRFNNQDLVAENMLVDKLSPKLSSCEEVIDEAQRIHTNMFSTIIGHYKYAMLFNFAAFENKGDPAITAGELIILRLKIKRNDWLIADTCPQAANHYALF